MTFMSVRAHAGTDVPAGRLRDLLGAIGRRTRARSAATAPRPHTIALHTTTTTPWTARGVLTLALHDGVERLYLLDPRDFAATTSPQVAYDARVHAAYILATQGHRPEWLAPHLDLPLTATRAVCAHAEQHEPHGPREGTGELPQRAWSAGG